MSAPSYVSPRGPPGPPACVAPAHPVSKPQAAGEDPQLQTLKEVRDSGGLREVPVQQALAKFRAAADDNKLTQEQFLQAYRDLLMDCGLPEPEKPVQEAAFSIFDRDLNGVVDLMELICGISTLCAGTEEEKIQAVFQVFDDNGDGFISIDEMFKFITAVFKVVLTPKLMERMNAMGVIVNSPEDLASVTAQECFDMADLNQDGKLSVDEFKTWFHSAGDQRSSLFQPLRETLA